MNMWVFFFQLVYIMDYINWFPYVEASQHHHNKACFVMVDERFGVVFISVCEYFIILDQYS